MEEENIAIITFKHKGSIFTIKVNGLADLEKKYKKDFPIFQELLSELMALEDRRIQIKNKLNEISQTE